MLRRSTMATGTLGFILDKSAKWSETPVMQLRPLRLAGLSPLTDTFEIFKGNAASGAFRREDDAFRDAGILVFLGPLLPAAAHLAKSALSGACARALQGGALLSIALSADFPFCPRMPVA